MPQPHSTPTASAGMPTTSAGAHSLGTPVTKSLGQHVKSWRTWVIMMLIFMLITIWHALSTQTEENPLSPTSAAPGGTKAFFKILEKQGAEVSYFNNTENLPPAGADTTVVIIGTSWTWPHALRDIFENSTDARRIVLIAVSRSDLGELGLRIETTISTKDIEGPLYKGRCPVDIFGKVDHVSPTARIFEDGPHRPPIQCFLNQGQSPVGIWPANQVLNSDGTTLAHPQLVGFADAKWFTNRRTIDDQNGALGLTVINRTPKVQVFYLDDSVDAPNDNAFKPPADADSFFPRWLNHFYTLLFFAMIFVIIERRRRFGRLAYERLPITVKSSETIHSLGRLYEQNQANTHAAHLLQVDAVKRLRRALYLNSQNTDAELLNLLAVRTSRAIPELQALLFQPFNGSPAELTVFNKQLDALIQEVTNV